jgi:hypothetical protein
MNIIPQYIMPKLPRDPTDALPASDIKLMEECSIIIDKYNILIADMNSQTDWIQSYYCINSWILLSNELSKRKCELSDMCKTSIKRATNLWRNCNHLAIKCSKLLDKYNDLPNAGSNISLTQCYIRLLRHYEILVNEKYALMSHYKKLYASYNNLQSKAYTAKNILRNTYFS